jgi:hypothetical protein
MQRVLLISSKYFVGFDLVRCGVEFTIAYY